MKLERHYKRDIRHIIISHCLSEYVAEFWSFEIRYSSPFAMRALTRAALPAYINPSRRYNSTVSSFPALTISRTWISRGNDLEKMSRYSWNPWSGFQGREYIRSVSLWMIYMQ
jgi:hypothetical protein